MVENHEVIGQGMTSDGGSQKHFRGRRGWAGFSDLSWLYILRKDEGLPGCVLLSGSLAAPPWTGLPHLCLALSALDILIVFHANFLERFVDVKTLPHQMEDVNS